MKTPLADRWGFTWNLPDSDGEWPTAAQEKERHLRELHQEIADLKAAAEAQQLEDECAQYEQELPKS